LRKFLQKYLLIEKTVSPRNRVLWDFMRGMLGSFERTPDNNVWNFGKRLESPDGTSNFDF